VLAKRNVDVFIVVAYPLHLRRIPWGTAQVRSDEVFILNKGMKWNREDSNPIVVIFAIHPDGLGGIPLSQTNSRTHDVDSFSVVGSILLDNSVQNLNFFHNPLEQLKTSIII
jgi:hypothetical protein